MRIDAVQILLQIVNFTILLVVLTRFLYRPLLKIMEARSKKIQEGLEAAESSLEQQAKIEAERQHQLAKTEAEAAHVLDQARLEAKDMSRDIVAAAKAEAREEAAKEYAIIKGKIAAEETKVRRNIVKLLTQTTESVLQGSLTEKSHRQIIKTQIRELSKIKP